MPKTPFTNIGERGFSSIEYSVKENYHQQTVLSLANIFCTRIS